MASGNSTCSASDDSEEIITYIQFSKIDSKLLVHPDKSDDREWETMHPLKIVNEYITSEDFDSTKPCPFCKDKKHARSVLAPFAQTSRDVTVACGLKCYDLLYCHLCGIQMDNISQADQHYNNICLTDEYCSDDLLYSHKRKRVRIIIDDIVDILNKALHPRRAQELLSLWKKSLFENASAFNLRLTYDYYVYFFYPMVVNYVDIMKYINEIADSDDHHGFDFGVCQQLRKRKAKKFKENDFEFRVIPHCAVLENVRLNVLNEMADNKNGRILNDYSHL